MSDSEHLSMAKKLIKGIIRLSASDQDYPKKTDFHKIVFLLQKRLEEENNTEALDIHVPFYWYFEGPYSEVIEGARQQLAHNNEVATKNSSGGTKLYTLNDTSDSELNDTLEITLEEICKSYNFYRTYSEIRAVYEEYAPEKFQLRFKFGFLESLSGLGSQLNSSQSGLSKHMDIEDDRFSKLKLQLIRSESSLPRSGFEEFRAVFGRFYNLAKLHLEMIESEKMPEQSISLLEEVSKDVWRVFGKFARINYSDDYYNSSIESWEDEKELAIKGLEGSLEEYEKKVLEQTEDLEMNEHISSEDSAWANIVYED